MRKLLLVVAGLAVFALSAGTINAQQTIFKSRTTGALIKAGADGVDDEATTGTATSTAAAATLNTDSGTVTTESLTTAGLADYTFTLTNSKIKATSKVFVSVATASAGTPGIGTVTPADGTCVIKIHNLHATVAFNNVLKISFLAIQ